MRSIRRGVTRREALALFGGVFLHATRSARACVLAPSLTQGPFWVDEKLERSDLTERGKIEGVPLRLHIEVTSSGDECRALAGVHVDVWHCDAHGVYSDADNMGQTDTKGRKFLRGYQRTDGKGRVSFKTIVPGWYFGRTVHVHVKLRRFDENGKLTTEATTQLFFDDALTDALFASHAAYKRDAARDLHNADDMIYGGHSDLLVPLTGNAKKGYEGRAVLAIADGVVTKEENPPGGPPPWGKGPPPHGMGPPPPGMWRPPPSPK